MNTFILVSVLHFASTNQDRAINMETLQIPVVACSQGEKDIREYYSSERYSRIVNLKCMKVVK